MIAKETIFREYDIRGVVGVDFDSGLAERLGLAFAKQVKAANPEKKDCTVAVGFDCRLSGEELRQALTKGLVEGGMKVVDSGMGPTPQLYYATLSRELDGGIQVTGSHNPADQNGFKMMIGKKTLSGNDIQQLKKDVFSGLAAERPFQESHVEMLDARTAYIAELIERSRPYVLASRKLKVVVDGGNGVGGLVGPALLRGLGCEVIELYTEPDGRFPNHHPDPTVIENIQELRERVVREKADVGIAWDGDADRIGVVDETGEPIFGDLLLVLYGRQLLKEVSKPIIIGDVKCSELMFSDLKKRGAETVMAKTGHSLIKAKLKELHAHLAGEMSGHMFFAHRYYGFDDALHAAARLIEILSHSDQSVSQMLGDLPKMYSTPEIRVDCAEEAKFSIAEKAKQSFPEYEVNTLDGVRITFPHGWGLVRASNTQPILVMRFEADSAARLAEYQQLVEKRIAEIQAAG